MENEKTYLGTLCKNKHNYNKTDYSLRFKADRSCIECKKAKRRKRNSERKSKQKNKFYIGEICNNNHKHNKELKSLRYISNNDCVECKKNNDKKSYNKRKEQILKNKKIYYLDNKEALLVKNKEYYLKNKNDIIEKNKNYYNKNKKHLNKKNWERIKKKLETESVFRLNRRMSNSITKALKRKNTSKNGFSYLDLVDFKIEELVEHLEKQFTEGMSWENYGKWHVDHIKPKSIFEYDTPNDKSFKECWSLSNFQPLWGKDNLSKGKKSIEEWLNYKNKKNDKNKCGDSTC